MKMLALEFSSPRRSVAVLEAPERPESTADAALAPGRPGTVLGSAAETVGRSTKACGLIESALRQAGVEREQVDRIAVGLGPGSYTGIRAAIAVAAGWQMACAVKVLGLLSTEALALQAQRMGLRGAVHIVLDAQRGDVCLAQYDIQTASRRELAPLRLASVDDVKAGAAAGATIIGPEASQWFPEGHVIFPAAAALGELACGRAHFAAAAALEPAYVRAPDFVKKADGAAG